MRRLVKVLQAAIPERGATAIVVALLMTVLLGAAGLAIDLGASYAKKQELQNGADAAALALAQEYAFEDDPCGAARSSGDATTWVGKNVTNDSTSSTGTVECTAEDATLKKNQLRVVADATQDHWFMPALGKDSSEIAADATVEFGVPGKLMTSPVTIAECALPSAEELEEGLEIVVWFPDPSGTVDADDKDTCGWHDKYPPGGFGVIQPDTKGSCDVTITLEMLVYSAPGASEIGPCMDAMIGEINFVPIFDVSQSSGKNGSYKIVHFAAIRVEFIGFKSETFGDKKLGCPKTGRPLWTHKNQPTCLRGTFEGLVSIEDYLDELVMPEDEDTAIVVRFID